MRKDLLRAVAAALVWTAFVLFPVSPVDAQQPPAVAAPEQGFVPVTDLPAQEQLPAAPLVMGAYAVAWVAVFLYIWSLWRRLAGVEREIAAVSRRIDSGVARK